MPKTTSADQKDILELATVISVLSNPTAIRNFLYDVATPQEIADLSQRYKIAKLLWTTELSYQAIAEKTKASTTTITRVARFLKQEPFGGYRETLNLLYPKK